MYPESPGICRRQGPAAIPRVDVLCLLYIPTIRPAGYPVRNNLRGVMFSPLMERYQRSVLSVDGNKRI